MLKQSPLTLLSRQVLLRLLSSNANKTHQPQGYGMTEDWKETGRAVRDRTTEILTETAKASRDAVKAAASSSPPNHPQTHQDPAKSVPPESVNEYDTTSTVSDLRDAVKTAGKKAMEKVKRVYDKIEGMPNREPTGPDMPSDGPSEPMAHTHTLKHDQDEVKGRGYGDDEAEREAGITDETTKEAFAKGKRLQEEREPMKGS